MKSPAFILFAASAFRKLLSIYVFSYFPFGFEGRIWDLIVSVPDHCLSFYFAVTFDWVFVKRALNEDRHKSSNEFKFRPDRIISSPEAKAHMVSL